MLNRTNTSSDFLLHIFFFFSGGCCRSSAFHLHTHDPFLQTNSSSPVSRFINRRPWRHKDQKRHQKAAGKIFTGAVGGEEQQIFRLPPAQESKTYTLQSGNGFPLLSTCQQRVFRTKLEKGPEIAQRGRRHRTCSSFCTSFLNISNLICPDSCLYASSPLSPSFIVETPRWLIMLLRRRFPKQPRNGFMWIKWGRGLII